MPPRPPKVTFHPPSKTFERSGGQATFIEPLGGTRTLGNGTYLVNPVEASYSKESPLAIIRRHALELDDLQSNKPKLFPNADARRKYGMLQSALEDAVMAGNKFSPNEEMRLLMQLGSNGKPVGAATFQKGDAYGLSDKDLTDLNFTGPEPGTAHSLGVLGATEGDKKFMTGTEYIQQLQDMLGNNHLYFETIDKPAEGFSNIGYYYGLGARATGKKRSGGNPFYEFKQRAKREEKDPEVNSDQLRLPGMKKGGSADDIRNMAHAIADRGDQSNGYEQEILDEQQRRRERDTLDDLIASREAKRQARIRALQAQRDALLKQWGQRRDIYGQDMADEAPVDEMRQMIDRQMLLGAGKEYPHSGPRSQGPTINEALAVSPIEGIKGLTRGALAAPAFLGDIGNLGYSGAKILMGRPEEGIPPSKFPYGFEGATRWLANNVPGLGRDPVFEDVGSAGETIGMMSPRAAALPARMLSGALGKMLNRGPRMQNLARVLTLPSPRSVAPPSPRPEFDTSRWTDLMKDINANIESINRPRPKPSRPGAGINPAELERMQPDLSDIARTLDRINESPRRSAAQYLQLDPWGRMVKDIPVEYRQGGSV